MEYAYWVLALLAGVAAGLFAARFIHRVRLSALEERLLQSGAEVDSLKSELTGRDASILDLKSGSARLEAALEYEKAAAGEKLEILNKSAAEMREAFKALSSDALRDNNQSFLELAKSTLEKFQSEAKSDLEAKQKSVETLVTPIKDSLEKVDAQLQEVEKVRRETYGGLSEQVRSLITTQERLHSETENLVKALRTPNVRGRWGEIQLRRVVEISGMVSYCDYAEQESVSTDSGSLLRPDMIIKLPGGRWLWTRKRPCPPISNPGRRRPRRPGVIN